jgi:hypothetical protein
MLLPLTLMDSAGSGLGAGPPTTAPFVMLNLLPWQGQSIVPSATWLTRHPMCVHTALKALKSPESGWVTTTFSVANTLPPPTGISLVVARAVASAPMPFPALAVSEMPGLVSELPEPPEEQALTAPARPTRPTPASTPRRVDCVFRWGSPVTGIPVCSSVSAPTPGYENGPEAGLVHAAP